MPPPPPRDRRVTGTEPSPAGGLAAMRGVESGGRTHDASGRRQRLVNPDQAAPFSFLVHSL
ncbi:hypothetical protein ACQR2B_32535 [Bradyrhizobium oligotrophicum]|uniref:hypothetical protein n=1 Tax=Bradyrhizobium TaxID=374 RepID=UPI003EC0290D